ncbi:hypothetical protein MADA3029_720002 [Vibrio nigripulchritudo MADA3029]|nr:hypothetical protein MADA3029_720002 [Vibrio nigripulchritudo MADA3029]
MPIDLCETVVSKSDTLSVNFRLTLPRKVANCINREHKLSLHY